MENNKLFSMLGLARRAGRLSMGHDMAMKALLSGKAKILLFAADISPRLMKEFEHLINKKNINITVLNPNITINEIYCSCGYKAGVITIDDENFVKKIISLLQNESN